MFVCVPVHKKDMLGNVGVSCRASQKKLVGTIMH